MSGRRDRRTVRHVDTERRGRHAVLATNLDGDHLPGGDATADGALRDGQEGGGLGHGVEGFRVRLSADVRFSVRHHPLRVTGARPACPWPESDIIAREVFSVNRTAPSVTPEAVAG